MTPLVITGIAVGLAMDAFSVAIATSVRLRGVTKRQTFRLAWHFGLFQALMPMLGWLAGQSVAPFISAWDHWVAFVLLTGIGLRTLVQAVRDEVREDDAIPDPTRGASLVLLSVATSIDALAVGLGLAFLEMNLWALCLAIGLITGALTAAGMIFGVWIGRRMGDHVEIVGGLVLIGIGLKILLEHLGVL
jgi:putative Mn2+ efflux pump MntP